MFKTLRDLALPYPLNNFVRFIWHIHVSEKYARIEGTFCLIEAKARLLLYAFYNYNPMMIRCCFCKVTCLVTCVAVAENSWIRTAVSAAILQRLSARTVQTKCGRNFPNVYECLFSASFQLVMHATRVTVRQSPRLLFAPPSLSHHQLYTLRLFCSGPAYNFSQCSSFFGSFACVSLASGNRLLLTDCKSDWKWFSILPAPHYKVFVPNLRNTA